MSNLDSRSIFSGKLFGQVLLTGEMKLLISGSVLDKQVAVRAGLSEGFIAAREIRILDSVLFSNSGNIKLQVAESYFGLNNHRFI